MKMALACIAMASAAGSLRATRHKLDNAVSQQIVQIPGLGVVQGRDGLRVGTKDAVDMYLGIPYAKAPVHARRWKAPQPHDGWENNTSPLNATYFGSRCMQHLNNIGRQGFPTPTAEDCLFLNIATPKAVYSQKKLPVMLFIHGGAYVNGQSNTYAIDSLVTRSHGSVVAVSINYRLNVFGFLGSKALQTDGDMMTGNYGIQDQRLAMQWVKQHIGAFGGDGSDITIFGESAGGNSVINHLAQKASFPFYTKAIIESGAYNMGARSMEDATKQYEKIVQRNSCGSGGGSGSDADCLRLVPASELVDQQQQMFVNLVSGASVEWGPTVDGVSLTDTPAALIAKKEYNNKVPIIIGSNRDEMAFFFLLSPFKRLAPANLGFFGYSAIMLTQLVKMGTGENLVALNKLYDPAVYEYPKDLGSYSMWWWKAMRIVTEQVPGLGPCSVRWLSRLFVEGGSPAVYSYFFEHPTQAVTGVPGSGPGSVVVPHGSEIEYVLGNTDALERGEEADLAMATSAYWASFAVTGKPGAAALPQWPRYTVEGAASDTTIRFDTMNAGGIRIKQGLRKAQCDYHQKRHEENLETSLGLLAHRK